MTDTHEKKSGSSGDDHTIRIEIPAGAFEKMCNMMSGRRTPGPAMSGCCESSRDECCPEPGGSSKQEFTFVLKRKE